MTSYLEVKIPSPACSMSSALLLVYQEEPMDTTCYFFAQGYKLK